MEFNPGKLASTLVKKQVSWLWDKHLMEGAINMITAAPGTGKSTMTCEIAAALSQGRPLPGETNEQAKARGIKRTWMFNAEDDPETTVLWRLDNQKADTKHIQIKSDGQAIDKAIAKEMATYIEKNKFDVIILDPVQAWIGADADMYRPNHVRAWGNHFRDICAATGCTVIWVRHRRKGDADDHNSVNSGLGSIDFSGIVRCELSITEVKCEGNIDACKIQRIKGNIGKKPEPLYYTIEDTGQPDNVHGQLNWQSDIREYKKSTPRERTTQSSGIATWIIGLLTSGGKPVQEIIDAAERLGYAKSTIYKQAENITIKFREGGVRYWRLRTPADENEQQIDDDNATD